EQQPARLAGEVEERERRHEDPEEEGQPAETRHRAAVEPASLGTVDDPEQSRHTAHGRREKHHDRGCEQRPPDDFKMVGERMKHQVRARIRPTAMAAKTSRKKATATAVPTRASRA